MLTNCLAECAHLTITVSEIERDIGRKSSFFHTPLHSTPPLRGFTSEHRHPVWHAKTRMTWLPDGEKISKISLFVLEQLTNVTDRQTNGQTPGDSIYLAYAYASHGKNWMDTWLLKLDVNKCKSVSYGRCIEYAVSVCQKLSKYNVA